MFSRKKTGREMSFLQHLEELRWAILKSVLAILVGMIACFSFHEYIVEFLISPTLLEGLKIEIEMQAIRPAGMFTTIVNISLVGGFALALPYVLYQLWSFVSPGLMDKEKKYVPIVIFFSCVLFLVGAAFAFYILIPVMVRFFIQLYVPGIRAQWDIGFWIGLVNKMVLIMGVVFQMPIVVAFLTWLRILSADKLMRVWRIALVVIFIVAAIITPTGDPYTQTLVAIPLVVLYFISMGIAMLIGRSRRKAEADEDGDGDDDSDGEDGGDSDEEQPALTTEEPDTPTLPRDSSTGASQGTGRAYWPEGEEYIYDYDAEMGFSEEPEEKRDSDESDKAEEEADTEEAPDPGTAIDDVNEDDKSSEDPADTSNDHSESEEEDKAEETGDPEKGTDNSEGSEDDVDDRPETRKD